MSEISVPFLPTIKCTSCHLHIDVRTLDKHACVPITKANSKLPLSVSIDMQINQALPPPNVQRRSRERSNALNKSVRRIFQKIKGNDQQYKSTDSSGLSPTLSMFSSTSSHQTIPTPRSSEDYIQQYLLKQGKDTSIILCLQLTPSIQQVDMDPIIFRKIDDSLFRLESRDCKSKVSTLLIRGVNYLNFLLQSQLPRQRCSRNWSPA